jgi:hypothetical protein
LIGRFRECSLSFEEGLEGRPNHALGRRRRKLVGSSKPTDQQQRSAIR